MAVAGGHRGWLCMVCAVLVNVVVMGLATGLAVLFDSAG